MWSATAIGATDLRLSKQSFWNKQNGSLRELHDTTRRFAELLQRLVAGIDAHHDQIGIPGGDDTDEFDARPAGDHDVATIATGPEMSLTVA